MVHHGASVFVQYHNSNRRNAFHGGQQACFSLVRARQTGTEELFLQIYLICLLYISGGDFPGAL